MVICDYSTLVKAFICRSQWPRGLRHGVCGRWLAGIVGLNSAGGMVVCFECCVLSGGGLCVRPVTRSTECSVYNERDRETS